MFPQQQSGANMGDIAARTGRRSKKAARVVASLRILATLGWRFMVGCFLPRPFLFHAPLVCLHVLIGRGVELLFVCGHAEIVGLSLVDRTERGCAINIHVAYRADWVLVG
jgi:hypothetical protein